MLRIDDIEQWVVVPSTRRPVIVKDHVAVWAECSPQGGLVGLIHRRLGVAKPHDPDPTHVERPHARLHPRAEGDDAAWLRWLLDAHRPSGARRRDTTPPEVQRV